MLRHHADPDHEMMQHDLLASLSSEERRQWRIWRDAGRRMNSYFTKRWNGKYGGRVLTLSLALEYLNLSEKMRKKLSRVIYAARRTDEDTVNKQWRGRIQKGVIVYYEDKSNGSRQLTCFLDVLYQVFKSIQEMGRDDPVTYAGWVFKEGSLVRSWKKRFLVCKRAELAYYKNMDEENRAQLLGALTAAHIERLPEIENGLLIHGTEGRQLKIFLDTKVECDRCYKAIAQYCKMQDPSQDAHQRVGWLEKEGQYFRTWKKRYFVLTGTQLTYSAAMGAERLGGGLVTSVSRDPTRPFTLVITFEGGRELRVGGKSEVDIDEWHKAIQRGLVYAQKQRKSGPSLDDDPRNVREREFAKRQAQENAGSDTSTQVTYEEASSLFGSGPVDAEDAPPAYSSLQEQAKAENDQPHHGESNTSSNPPAMYAASSFRRHIVVETMPDNTASFIEVAEEHESEDDGEKPYSPTAPGITTIRRMRLAEKLLQEELEEERREAMRKENTILMRPPSKSDAPEVKGCCCLVM
ncbi:hypothetical protein PsorP6_001642 [Peronosclerospora sorghi]|uniref:Uncharacterized protein n=1 Tax=Peronosclerospora sorghi TaxID=230839 RepID=A0ACC0WVF1_9STRA|nr:hypothetical protein PsorP6_001642 [Peronosclerospora sorghi]